MNDLRFKEYSLFVEKIEEEPFGYHNRKSPENGLEGTEIVDESVHKNIGNYTEVE